MSVQCYATTFVFIFVGTVMVHLRLEMSPSLCTAMMMTCETSPTTISLEAGADLGKQA